MTHVSAHTALLPTATDYLGVIERGSPDPRYRAKRMRDWEDFCAAYPDLSVWASEPLGVRIGRLPREHRASCTSPVNYCARSYIVYLGMTGRVALDYDWLLAMPSVGVWELAALAGDVGFVEMNTIVTKKAADLGYYVRSAARSVRWVIARLALHTGKRDIRDFTIADIAELEHAIEQHCQRADLAQLHGSMELFLRRRAQWRSFLYTTKVILFHLGTIAEEPRRPLPTRATWPMMSPEMSVVVARHLKTQRAVVRVTTMENIAGALRRFTCWLSEFYPSFERFSEVDRSVAQEYIAYLDGVTSGVTGRRLAASTKRSLLQCLYGFFREGAAWGWEGMPQRVPLAAADLPRLPWAIPRYIPDHELNRITDAIKGLTCPFQKAALLTARWCGARRGEIRRLELACLDAYPDGTPRLRIPVGKTYRERLVPVNPEAADALRAVAALRAHDGDRPMVDSHSARPTRYLFVRHGKLLGFDYLFAESLRTVCREAGLTNENGHPLVTTHRFRHTVGTQLAERGARMPTIMAVLGHRSATMSLVYAHVSDQVVLREYEAVLGPSATLAGPYASAIREGELDNAALDWLKTNFLKTELELGRCLRLPQEGPCECDLALSCAKFVTTPQYAPRLRTRRELELELATDAEQRGWPREVERHRSVVSRIDKLLRDLGEPIVAATDVGLESVDDASCGLLDSRSGGTNG